MRVLVVDDQKRYRAYLGSMLDARGHEVAVACSGREAIDVGIRFRPELLVTDWMLCDHLHGLQVSQALRTIDPDLPTILMTGFASDELRVEARRGRVFHFLEKPFEIDSLESAVSRAAHRGEVRREAVPFGVLVVDESGIIVSISAKARDMLRRTRAGSQPTRLSDLFEAPTLADIEQATERWIHVGVIAPGRIRWWLRARHESRMRVLVLLPERRIYLRSDPRVGLLLDLELQTTLRLESDTRVLILDDRSPPHPSYLEALERIGCVAHRADSVELGMRLLRADPALGLVVIDCDPRPGLEALVANIRGIRAEAVIVGVSNTPVEAACFASAGVTRQLHRPWRVGDLVALFDD